MGDRESGWMSCPCLRNPPQGAANLVEEIARLYRSFIHCTCHSGPGGGDLIVLAHYICATCVGEAVHSPPIRFLALDQPQILKQLQRWIDRPWAWPPDIPATRRDLRPCVLAYA